MLNYNRNRTREDSGVDYIIITDESGILRTFNFIADHLSDKGPTHLTLIYNIPNSNTLPVFENELYKLEMRYSARLSFHLVKKDTQVYYFIQELIQTISDRNSKTRKKFLVFGSKEFVKQLSGIQRFQDENNSTIKFKIA
jgi:hypothetical protein